MITVPLRKKDYLNIPKQETKEKQIVSTTKKGSEKPATEKEELSSRYEASSKRKRERRSDFFVEREYLFISLNNLSILVSRKAFPIFLCDQKKRKKKKKEKKNLPKSVKQQKFET